MSPAKIIKSLLEGHRVRKAEAKRSMANVRVIRSAESPMFVGLKKIKQRPGESAEEAGERRRKAFAFVVANSL